MTQNDPESGFGNMASATMSIADCMLFYEKKSATSFAEDAILTVGIYMRAIDDGKAHLAAEPDITAYKATASMLQRWALPMGHLGLLAHIERVMRHEEPGTEAVLDFADMISEMERALDATRVIFQFCTMAGRDICGRPLEG